MSGEAQDLCRILCLFQERWRFCCPSPNRPERLAAWYSSGVGPCTTLSLMSRSGLQLYSKNLIIVREWQEYWHLCLGYILCFVGNWCVYPVCCEVWTVKAFLSICFPWFKVEDKLVCETVTRVKFFVGLNSNVIITGSQVNKIVRWVLVLWWEMGYIQSTSTGMKDTWFGKL